MAICRKFFYFCCPYSHDFLLAKYPYSSLANIRPYLIRDCKRNAAIPAVSIGGSLSRCMSSKIMVFGIKIWPSTNGRLRKVSQNTSTQGRGKIREHWADDWQQALLRGSEFWGREKDLFCKMKVGGRLAYPGGVMP